MQSLKLDARQRLLDRIAGGLRPNAHLVVGKGDNGTIHSKVFDPLDRQGIVYRRRRHSVEYRRASPAHEHGAWRHQQAMESVPGRSGTLALARERLIDLYSPPALIVDETEQILEMFGQADLLFGTFPKTDKASISTSILPDLANIVIPAIKRAGDNQQELLISAGKGSSGRQCIRGNHQSGAARVNNAGQLVLMIVFEISKPVSRGVEQHIAAAGVELPHPKQQGHNIRGDKHEHE